MRLIPEEGVLQLQMAMPPTGTADSKVWSTSLNTYSHCCYSHYLITFPPHTFIQKPLPTVEYEAVTSTLLLPPYHASANSVKLSIQAGVTNPTLVVAEV